MKFTIRVIEITGWLASMIGAHDYRYEVIDQDGNIVATASFEDDANNWCYQWNLRVKNELSDKPDPSPY